MALGNLLSENRLILIFAVGGNGISRPIYWMLTCCTIGTYRNPVIKQCNNQSIRILIPWTFKPCVDWIHNTFHRHNKKRIGCPKSPKDFFHILPRLTGLLRRLVSRNIGIHILRLALSYNQQGSEWDTTCIRCINLWLGFRGSLAFGFWCPLRWWLSRCRRGRCAIDIGLRSLRALSGFCGFTSLSIVELSANC